MSRDRFLIKAMAGMDSSCSSGNSTASIAEKTGCCISSRETPTRAWTNVS